MLFIRSPLHLISWVVKTAFLLFLAPIVIAAVLSLFYGPAPLTTLTIVYVDLMVWPFEVHSEFSGVINYVSVVERSGVIECTHTVLRLHTAAQPQPYALDAYQFDWQPQRSGPAESQATGDESWVSTPVPESVIERRLWELRNCGLSDETYAVAQKALRETGSWIAQDTRCADEVMIYAAPHNIAIKFSNET